jgi:hypothetical protein
MVVKSTVEKAFEGIWKAFENLGLEKKLSKTYGRIEACLMCWILIWLTTKLSN